ncbi:MAG: methylated-DNA--[protein]-cysteine S-methyltransferase [Eubacteriales bacterium]|jgi:methylated-DNA-[protein]-cysteine S-methyltransferase
MEYVWYWDGPLGRMGMKAENGALTGLWLGEKAGNPSWQWQQTPLLRETCRQLEEYFAGQRRVFQLPLAPRGTEFQKRVWQALGRIPYGQVRTYGQVAAEVGCPKGPRAVGQANHCNPIIVVIPCHRVVATNGLGGYGGGLEVKKALLRLEQEGGL